MRIYTLVDLKQQFSQNFEIKDLGEVNQYHWVKITRENVAIKVDHKQYTKDILKHFESLIQSHDKWSHATAIKGDLKLTKLNLRKRRKNKQSTYKNSFTN